MVLRVLLVEDDTDIAAGLCDYLQTHGVVMDYARDARRARLLLQASHFDACVFDVNLPGTDGVRLCREIKHEWRFPMPIIFLTARDALHDKLAGFDAGGTDWIVKPFEPAELLARLRALTSAASHRHAALELRVGDYALTEEAGLLRHRQRSLQLHATSVIILRSLLQAHPAAVARQRLITQLWPDDMPDSDPLRTHIHQLRRAIERAFGTAPIVTERGIGYRFDAST